MLEFITKKYYNFKWADKSKYLPTSYKFYNSKFVTELSTFAKAAVKLCGLIIIVKIISIVLTILFEIIALTFNSDDFYFLFGLFAEFIYGVISFGMIKSIVIIISAKFIRNGISGQSIKWNFIFGAAAVIFFGFGFWASLSTIVSLALFIYFALNEPFFNY